jgi:hypothetical protein
MITEEAEKLYRKLLKCFTSSVVDNAAFIMSLPLLASTYQANLM